MLLTVQAAGQQGAAPLVFKSSRDLRERTGKTITSVERYVKQLEKTAHSLDRLAESEKDLGDRYKAFASELRSLEKAQLSAESQIKKLREIGTRYFTAWDRAITTITDPYLRTASSDRRAVVMERYRVASDRISEIAVDIPVLLVRMRDLNIVLAADLTPEGVRRADRAMEDCRLEAREMIPRVKEFRDVLRQLQADAPR